MVDVFLFKSIMIVVSVGVGGALLLRTLRRLPAASGRWGLALGATWMLINWSLDAAILFPMTGMTLGFYVTSIGLRYLAMPIQGYLLGCALEAQEG